MCWFLTKKGSGRSATERLRSAIGIAEVDAGLVAPGFGQFAFLFLVFGEFLVGVGKGVARSEHGVGLGGQLLLLAQGAEFVADLTDRPFDRFHFHEQITHFFKKIMKVVRTENVRKARGFQMNNELGAGQFGNEGKGRGFGHRLLQGRWQVRAG